MILVCRYWQHILVGQSVTMTMTNVYMYFIAGVESNYTNMHGHVHTFTIQW